MTYPSYFPQRYRYRPPEPKKKTKNKDIIKHFKRNKHHYEFIALSIILGLLAALAVTLSTKH